jgi:hypothetical protein
MRQRKIAPEFAQREPDAKIKMAGSEAHPRENAPALGSMYSGMFSETV